MDYIQNVCRLVQEFTTCPKHVFINESCIQKTAKALVEAKEKSEIPKWGVATCLLLATGKINVPKFIQYELIATSVNYCYWYGKSTYRPLNASSTKMYELLTDCFEDMDELKKEGIYSLSYELEIIIDMFKEKLSRNRFPLLDQRIQHLEEIKRLPISTNATERTNMHDWLDFLIVHFPGYAKDMFLKRAFLFIIQLHRTLGIFEDEIAELPVPADYQVPNVLRWQGCIHYTKALTNKIDLGELIPEGSREECEIRAATILACELIAERVGCSSSDVDTYLWTKRKEVTYPFHLTRTTNY